MTEQGEDKHYFVGRRGENGKEEPVMQGEVTTWVLGTIEIETSCEDI